MWFSPLLQGGATGQDQPPAPSPDSRVREPQRDLPVGVRGGADVWDQIQAGPVLDADWFAPDVSTGPTIVQADLAASGASSASFSSARVVNATFSALGGSSVALPSQAVRNTGLNASGTSTAAFADESTYPFTDPERFIEVLGAEILHFEIVGENKGPTFSDGDMTASGAASLVIGAARVLPTLHASAGSGSTSISARSISLVGLAPTGTSSASFGVARVLPSSAASSGSSALSLAARAIAQAAATAAGSSTVATQTQALKDAVVNGSGSSNVFAPTQVLADGLIGFGGSSAAHLIGRLVQSGGLEAAGMSASAMSGLSFARFIDAQDMERGAEFRAMERGPVDASMALSAETRMERGEERRSMEVAS